jgi:hypothetical protein
MGIQETAVTEDSILIALLPYNFPNVTDVRAQMRAETT